ncbi:MAG: adenylyl-sulfate kinase [Propionibacteriales bacterium]|nr:adenylyl-sulfate kinase [Propionibacteriales bacterium]
MSESLPQWTPDARELGDLELITNGSLAPIKGFLDPTDATDTSPITLAVPAELAGRARDAGAIELTDPEGVPLAQVTVESTYDAGEGRVGIAGPATALAHHEFGAFRRLFTGPGAVVDVHDGRPLIAVPVVEPLTSSAIADIRRALGDQQHGIAVLLPLVGEGSPRGVSAAGLIRATLAAAEEIGDAEVVAVPLARRDDDAADRRLRDFVAEHYATAGVLDYRNEGESPDAIRRIVDQDRPPRHRRGVVVFFTGFSGSGKSTLARALHDVLLERGGRTVTSLDGDVVRRHLSAGLGFSREDRETNIRRIGWVAAEISRHGGVAICSPIAPFDSTRQEVRRMVEAAGGGFVLVHVSTPIEECERRDRKGLYAKARAGEIPDFTGISSPYEVPEDATVSVDTTGRSIEDALSDVLKVLYAEGWLTRPGPDGELPAP